jgi:hypothetical protein
MPSKSVELSSANARSGVAIERAGDVLTFTRDNVEHGTEVTGPMFDAKLAELRGEASRPSARAFRIRARGKDRCTRRERAGKDGGATHKESGPFIEIKRALRVSRLVSIAEAHGDFVYVTDDASLDALAVRILQIETKSARRCEEFFQTPQQNSFDQNCRPAVEALPVGTMVMLAREKMSCLCQ